MRSKADETLVIMPILFGIVLHATDVVCRFTVSVFMFEFEPTGEVHPSYITQTVRLFSPSSGFYIDQLFIVSSLAKCL